MKPLIVGAGPVGMTVAVLLAQRGIRPWLIDKRPAPSTLRRAIAINQLTLSVLEQAGVLQRILAIGIQVSRLNVYRGRRPLATLSFEDTSLDHPYFFHVRQCDLERVLVERLEELKVEVLHGHALVALEERSQTVSASVVCNGTSRIFDSDYVLGCDGGSSTCCELAAIAVARQSYGGHFRLADVTLSRSTWMRDETHYYLHKSGYLMLIPAPQGETRVIASFQYPAALKSDHYSAAELQRLIYQRSGHVGTIDQVKWSTRAPFGQRLAAQAIKGRVILAGDSLHQFSPIGGTNMNVGIADAQALASALLDNTLPHYECERLAVVRQQVAATRYLTRLMVHPEGMAFPRRPFTSRTLHELLNIELPHALTGFGSSALEAARGSTA